MPGGLIGLMQEGMAAMPQRQGQPAAPASMPGAMPGAMPGTMGRPPGGGADPRMVLQAFNEALQQSGDVRQAVMQVAQQLGMEPQQVAQILLQFAPQQDAPGGGMPPQGMPGM